MVWCVIVVVVIKTSAAVDAIRVESVRHRRLGDGGRVCHTRSLFLGLFSNPDVGPILLFSLPVMQEGGTAAYVLSLRRRPWRVALYPGAPWSRINQV